MFTRSQSVKTINVIQQQDIIGSKKAPAYMLETQAL